VEVVEKLLGNGDAVAISVDVRSEKSDAKMGNVEEVGARGRCGELGTSFATELCRFVSFIQPSFPHKYFRIHKSFMIHRKI
jgi:hypothetical protein